MKQPAFTCDLVARLVGVADPHEVWAATVRWIWTLPGERRMN